MALSILISHARIPPERKWGGGGVLEMNKMSKERFEILLEDIKSDVKLVLEGHAVLGNKIEQVKTSVKENNRRIVTIEEVVKETNRTLKKHIRQPAHV